MRVAVVGAGIVGLATGFELERAGADVRVYERTGVASQQSKGDTRIFRSAHAEPHLARLALRARERWNEWENFFRRRLVGNEGLLVTGRDIAPAWAQATGAAGAPVHMVDDASVREHLSIARLQPGPVLLDPTGGATRVRRTVDLLSGHLGDRVHLTDVTAVEQRADDCLVHTADSTWACDEVVLTAGIDTARLAEPLGLGITQRLTLHSRFTFEIDPARRHRTQACWIDEVVLDGLAISAYAQPVGTTGRYALGLDWRGQPMDQEVGADEVSRQSLEVVRRYVAAFLPGLEPEPVDEIRCVWSKFGFLNGDDGFIARRSGSVTALYGNNLFKFGPLLGELLCNAALQRQVPWELREMDREQRDMSALHR